MISKSNYISESIELHLFFARIMKEHSLFFEAGFMKKDEDYKKVARDFQEEFGNVLYKAIELADGNITSEVLASEEIVTRNTLKAENLTCGASGLHIDENITKQTLSLIDEQKHHHREDEESHVNHLNEQVLPLLDKIIKFKSEVLNKVLECKMFTVNYPLLLKHMLREAQMYKDSLVKLQKRERINLAEQELFWNRQMMEHAEFIRGLLDPTEEKLLLTADKFAHEYKHIIENSKHSQNLAAASLQETINFKVFKEAGNDGILNCEIKSIIVPILTDHLLREANHFIRVMKHHNKDRFHF